MRFMLKLLAKNRIICYTKLCRNNNANLFKMQCVFVDINHIFLDYI